MIGNRIVIKTIDGQICSAVLVGDHTEYFKVKDVEELNCEPEAKIPNLNLPGKTFTGEVRYYKRNIIYSYISKP